MTNEPTILIIGGDGKVGRALTLHLARAGVPVCCTTRRPEREAGNVSYLDLACPDDWTPPDGVRTAILCAALANIESCRTNPREAWQVNVAGLLQVARKLHERGSSLVFLSTNAVFDGAKPHRQSDDPTCPITEYGRQKAEAERQLRQLDPQATIVRFAKILDPRVPLFAQWKQTLRSGQVIEPFADMSMAPIPMSCAISLLRLIVDRGAGGVYHVSGERDISYAQMGFWAAELLGADRKLVRPVSAAETGRVQEAPPRHTTLAVDRLVLEFGIQPPPTSWSIQQALREA